MVKPRQFQVEDYVFTKLKVTGKIVEKANMEKLGMDLLRSSRWFSQVLTN